MATSLQEPKELILELKREIKDKLTFENLEKYSQSLRPSNDAWKMEALCTLIEIFNLIKTDINGNPSELESIIEKFDRSL